MNSQGFTKRSPAQIRHQAATAFRNRSLGFFGFADPLRKPEIDETPLSSEEVKVGRALGLIRSSRVFALADGGVR